MTIRELEDYLEKLLRVESVAYSQEKVVGINHILSACNTLQGLANEVNSDTYNDFFRFYMLNSVNNVLSGFVNATQQRLKSLGINVSSELFENTVVANNLTQLNVNNTDFSAQMPEQTQFVEPVQNQPISQPQFTQPAKPVQPEQQPIQPAQQTKVKDKKPVSSDLDEPFVADENTNSDSSNFNFEDNLPGMGNQGSEKASGRDYLLDLLSKK